jgi:hypothetical protein
MTVVETRISVWEALAGRAPGVPSGPADPGLWHAVVERLNPARARPVLRKGIEDAHLAPTPSSFILSSRRRRPLRFRFLPRGIITPTKKGLKT